MYNINEFEEVLFNVLKDIKQYLPHLVIVGGWVPYIYSKYIWKEMAVFPVSTLDIDIGVNEIDPAWKNKTLYNRLSQLKYRMEPVYSEEQYPSVPVLKLENKNYEVRIEFITSYYVSDDTVNKLLGKEIAIHRLDEFEWLLNKTIEIDVNYSRQNIKIKVPEPYIFLFHKGLTFTEREVSKKAKDLYYMYYILRFCPDYEIMIGRIKTLKNDPLYGAFLQNIKSEFKSQVSEGPMKIESVSGFDPFVHSVRNDAFERVEKFIKDIETA